MQANTQEVILSIKPPHARQQHRAGFRQAADRSSRLHAVRHAMFFGLRRASRSKRKA